MAMPKPTGTQDAGNKRTVNNAGTSKPNPQPTSQELDFVLLQCNLAVARMIGDLASGAQADLAVLKEAAKALRASGGVPDDIAALCWIAHDLKGLGSSAGFPLLATVGERLCRLLRDRRTADGAMLDLIDRHIDAMDLILSEPITGDGGAEGTALLDTLRAAPETEQV